MSKKESIKLNPTLENQSKNIAKLITVAHGNRDNRIIKELRHISDILIDIIHEEFSSDE